VITYEEYHPFGTSSYQATNAGILSSSKRYRFCAKERDSESGLYYYGARYYVPWLCRFISCDPKAAQFPDQSPYNYCFNNPINLIDPDGMEPEGPDDPPKNNEPAANGNAANKLGDAFIPTPGEPVDPKNVRAAGIDGGAGATNLQNLKPGTGTDDQKPAIGHQYPAGTFQSKAADPRLRTVFNSNTTGLAGGDASNPIPTDAQLLEKAVGMLPSVPEIQIGKGALSASTSGEITAGIQRNDPNLIVNLMTGDLNKVGGYGVLASNESLEFGPYAVSNSINTITETNIQYNSALTPTAIVETGFVVQDRVAQFFGGIAETKVTVVESRTLIPSGRVVPQRKVGEVKQKFLTLGLNAYGFQLQFKSPSN
jgi:RHS repeat-associated protein